MMVMVVVINKVGEKEGTFQKGQSEIMGAKTKTNLNLDLVKLLTSLSVSAQALFCR